MIGDLARVPRRARCGVPYGLICPCLVLGDQLVLVRMALGLLWPLLSSLNLPLGNQAVNPIRNVIEVVRLTAKEATL